MSTVCEAPANVTKEPTLYVSQQNNTGLLNDAATVETRPCNRHV